MDSCWNVVIRNLVQGVDKLKQRLIETWPQIQQSVIDEAIDRWRDHLSVKTTL